MLSLKKLQYSPIASYISHITQSVKDFNLHNQTTTSSFLLQRLSNIFSLLENRSLTFTCFKGKTCTYRKHYRTSLYSCMYQHQQKNTCQKINISILYTKPWESNFQCKWDLNILLLPGKNLQKQMKQKRLTLLLTENRNVSHAQTFV